MALSEDQRIDCSNLSEEVLGTSDLIRTGFCRDVRITGCVLSQDREAWLLGHTWENSQDWSVAQKPFVCLQCVMALPGTSGDGERTIGRISTRRLVLEF